MQARPSVPSRGIYLFWFGLSGLFTFAMLGYLFWARSRGLLSWHQMWLDVVFGLLPPDAICLISGLLYRLHWAKRKRSFDANERMLAGLPPLD